jgi:hypothetical protein
MDTHGYSNGKTPEVDANDEGYRPTRGPRVTPHALVTVEPPRREDLQPSYAQVLSNDDASAHGWYGGMSTPLTFSSYPLPSP